MHKVEKESTAADCVKDTRPAPTAEQKEITRREAIKKLGRFAAVTAPAVIALTTSRKAAAS